MERPVVPVMRSRSHLILSLVLTTVILLVGFSGRLGAQEFRASITGQVMDSSGAVISGASITAVNQETRVAYSAKSDNQGVYSVLYVLPGSYTVTVEAARFETKIYNQVALQSAQQLGLNVTLPLGNVAQQVEVTADSVDLDTVSATVGGVVDQTRIENMPTAGLEVFDDVSFTEEIRSNSNARVGCPSKECSHGRVRTAPSTGRIEAQVYCRSGTTRR